MAQPGYSKHTPQKHDLLRNEKKAKKMGALRVLCLVFLIHYTCKLFQFETYIYSNLIHNDSIVVTSLFIVAPILGVLCKFLVLFCCTLCLLGLQSSWLTSSVTPGVTHSVPTAFTR